MTPQNETEIPADPKADARRGAARKKAFLALGVAVVVIGGGSVAYGAVFGGDGDDRQRLCRRRTWPR